MPFLEKFLEMSSLKVPSLLEENVFQYFLSWYFLKVLSEDDSLETKAYCNLKQAADLLCIEPSQLESLKIGEKVKWQNAVGEKVLLIKCPSYLVPVLYQY